MYSPSAVSMTYFIMVFLVFLGIAGFIIFAEIMTVDYVNQSSEALSKQKPPCKTSGTVKSNSDAIVMYSYLIIGAISLLLLLQLGQLIQLGGLGAFASANSQMVCKKPSVKKGGKK